MLDVFGFVRTSSSLRKFLLVAAAVIDDSRFVATRVREVLDMQNVLLQAVSFDGSGERSSFLSFSLS